MSFYSSGTTSFQCCWLRQNAEPIPYPSHSLTLILSRDHLRPSVRALLSMLFPFLKSASILQQSALKLLSPSLRHPAIAQPLIQNFKLICQNPESPIPDSMYSLSWQFHPLISLKSPSTSHLTFLFFIFRLKFKLMDRQLLNQCLGTQGF